MRCPRNLYARYLSRALLLGLLALPSWSQPLGPASTGPDGQIFFLQDSELLSTSPKGSLRATHLPEKFNALYPGGANWNSFLATSNKGLLRVDGSGTPPAKVLNPSADVTLKRWQDSYIAFAPKAKELLVISSEAERTLPLEGELLDVIVLGNTLLVDTSVGYLTLREPQGELVPVKLPFPAAEASLSYGAEKAVIWSSKSLDLIELPSGKQLKTNAKPEVGVLVLNDGSVLVSAANSMLHFNAEGGKKQYIPPAGASAAALAEWRVVSVRGLLDVITMKGERPQALHYSGRGIPMDQLPKGKIREILAPSDGQGAPLLFLETSLKEPEMDQRGRPVLDLATGQAREKSISGHKVFRLDTQRRQWIELSGNPRASLVGPIQQVGGLAVYATQTEPAHHRGQRLEVNRKFPNPPVVVHGQSLLDTGARWSYEAPHESAPSKSRLPEKEWPVLDERALLLTSESDTLLALDPTSGKLLWSSEPLPLDDSSPEMLSWKDGLALIATDSSTKSLLVINPSDGALVGSAALNDTFFWERWRHLLGVLVVCAALAYYIYAAGKRELYIRKIAGLQALDEAVGRATEMGKPVLYVVGAADVDDIQTLASLSILNHVAKKTAEYETPIITTTARAVVFSAAQEIVRDAFSVTGHPEAFSMESVRYISDDQFGYTAGVDGIMVREKPAANFYLGNFLAESLILAETGHATGSIQIAGTAQPNQLPFFVAACDYTLIGEELFAASAYLSRDPLQVGSLRGQDVGKAIVMILLLVCSVLYTMGIDWAKLSQWTGWSLT